MIFGIIATVSPTIKRVVRSSIGPCPNCGGGGSGSQVDHVELADRLSLFFIPVWSFNVKEAVYCNKCRFMSAPGQYEEWLVKRTLNESAREAGGGGWMRANPPLSGQQMGSATDSITAKACNGCGMALDDGWGYCPSCGTTA